MATIAKEPIQVYLPIEQVDALQALAQERGVTLDELIEQSVDALLANAPDMGLPPAEVIGERDPLWDIIERDPLWDIIGIGEADVTDLAENHDKYLREFEERGRS